MKNLGKTIKKLGLAKIIVAALTVAVLFACFGHMIYLVCFRQHLSSGDGEFMKSVWDIYQLVTEGDGIKAAIKETDFKFWAGFVAYFSLKTRIHPLELCHRIIPAILLVVALVEYLYLGYRFFVLERKGRYYTYMGMTVFAAAFFFLQYFIRYNNVDSACSMYINIWREHVIAMVYVLPLILATFLRIVYTHTTRLSNQISKATSDADIEDEDLSDESGEEEDIKNSKKTKKSRNLLSWVRDIIIIFVEIILCIVFYSGQHLYEVFSVDNEGFKYILKGLWETNWPFFMALGCIIICFMLKMKASIPVFVICILAALMGIPLPLAIVIAYGTSALIINPKSIDLWLPVSFVIFGIGIYVLAIETGSAAHFSTTFGPIENKYRIQSGTPELVDYLLSETPKEEGDSVYVVTDQQMAESIESFSPSVEAVVVDNVTTDTANIAFDAGLDQGDYVIIKSDIEPSEVLLINDEYAFDSKVGDYTVYRRTYWEETNGAWAHKGPYGFYLKDGWYKIDNELYYMNADGEVQTGWLKYDGETYYLKEDGKMVMNWEEIDDKWYFFGQDGAMRHDVTEAGYTLGPDGAMVEE